VARRLELTVVNSFTHTFEPHGLSSVLILAESHLAVHTWPEHRYLHLDVFTCSADTKITDLENVLQEEIPNRRMTTRQIVYG
jgi:S-adenosylmethionine decarboxylase proenzyme